MTNRFYRGLLGALLIISLYFDLAWLMYGIIVMLFFEGITNLLLPKLVDSFGQVVSPASSFFKYKPEPCSMGSRFGFESERCWRLVVGVMLLVTYFNYDMLWFFPWFMGFAIMGAGVSSMCPMLMALRWAGFR